MRSAIPVSRASSTSAAVGRRARAGGWGVGAGQHAPLAELDVVAAGVAGASGRAVGFGRRPESRDEVGVAQDDAVALLAALRDAEHVEQLQGAVVGEDRRAVLVEGGPGRPRGLGCAELQARRGGGLAAPAGPRDHPGEAVGVVGDGDRLHPHAELLELGDRPVQDDRQRVAVAGAAGDLLERRVAAGRPAGRAARGVHLVAAYGAGEQREVAWLQRAGLSGPVLAGDVGAVAPDDPRLLQPPRRPAPIGRRRRDLAGPALRVAGDELDATSTGRLELGDVRLQLGGRHAPQQRPLHLANAGLPGALGLSRRCSFRRTFERGHNVIEPRGARARHACPV